MCLIWVFAGLAKGYALKGEGNSTESLAYRGRAHDLRARVSKLRRSGYKPVFLERERERERE